MKQTNNSKVHGIIHTAALAAAGVVATPRLPLLHGTNVPAIAKIHIKMIMDIAEAHGVFLSAEAAARRVPSAVHLLAAAILMPTPIVWFPVVGNAAHAASAAAMTETVGWTSHVYFKRQAA